MESNVEVFEPPSSLFIRIINILEFDPYIFKYKYVIVHIKAPSSLLPTKYCTFHV